MYKILPIAPIEHAPLFAHLRLWRIEIDGFAGGIQDETVKLAIVEARTGDLTTIVDAGGHQQFPTGVPGNQCVQIVKLSGAPRAGEGIASADS